MNDDANEASLACAAASADMNPVERYMVLLAEEGFRPSLSPAQAEESWRFIRFKAQGRRFTVHVDLSDPSYFRLGSSFSTEARPHEVAAMAEVANHLNRQLKGVKTSLDADDGSVLFTIEAFLVGPPNAALFDRAISALWTAADQFFEARRPPAKLDA